MMNTRKVLLIFPGSRDTIDTDRHHVQASSTDHPPHLHLYPSDPVRRGNKRIASLRLRRTEHHIPGHIDAGTRKLPGPGKGLRGTLIGGGTSPAITEGGSHDSLLLLDQKGNTGDQMRVHQHLILITHSRMEKNTGNNGRGLQGLS